jgi:hypothetical protein
MKRKSSLKTSLMQLIELRHQGESIEILMANALRKHGSERAAAETLGISQQAFNLWKYRLGLADKIADLAANKEKHE